MQIPNFIYVFEKASHIYLNSVPTQEYVNHRNVVYCSQKAKTVFNLVSGQNIERKNYHLELDNQNAFL